MVVLVIAVVASWRAQPAESVRPAPTPPGAAPTVVRVSATQDWQTTNVAVAPGDVVEISTSGTWGPFGPGLQFDADGCGPPSCGPKETDAANVCTCITHAGLIGRVADGAVFPVGRSLQMTVRSPGVLSLRINDNRLADNAGSIQVTISTRSSG